MSSGRVLMWFRSDLRVRDNRALSRAAKDGTEGVVGLFLLSPAQWREHDWGAAKVGFVLGCLKALSESLSRLNIPLVSIESSRFADAPDAVIAAAKKYGCDAVYFNDEYEVNERRRDEAVKEACEKAGIACRGHVDQVLAEPGTIRTGEGKWYTVFTPFRRALYASLAEDPLSEAGGVRKQDPTGIESSVVPDRLAGFEGTFDDTLWPPGEQEAERRLREFIKDGVAKYKDARDFPARDGTSRLSPYLAAGAISARRCFLSALEANGGKMEGGKPGPATWMSELAWREFYRHVMAGFPRVSMGRAFKVETERVKWANSEEQFAAWCEGRTGVPIVDAAMRSLAATGWMHNRLRMVVAMYLTKNLLIDWRWGERWFMQHLVDGDLAQNNGGWQWSASTGTDAAPYFRIFNPLSQSRKFDPDGEFIRKWVPELGGLDAESMHEPSRVPPLARQQIDYPQPIVDLADSRERAIAAFKKAAN